MSRRCSSTPRRLFLRANNVLRSAKKDEVSLRTELGIERLLQANCKPKIILTATGLAARLCRRHFPEARIILWVHAPPEQRHEQQAKLAFRVADALVLPSWALYRSLWDRFSYEEFTPPVWVIHNFVDPTKFLVPTPEQREAARRKFGLSPNDFAIAHLSRGPVKGLQIMEAALPLVDVGSRRLVLFSAGDKITGTRQLDRSHEVRRLGRIPVSELLAMYHAADLGVIPSVWFETFSLGAIEMMACGLCVVASKSGGLPELIRDGENGRIISSPNDVELWASALREIINDSALRQRLAERGNAETMMTFEGTQFYDSWTRLINALLPRDAQPVPAGAGMERK